MCSEGVSVWFACKLCNSFFLNAGDFAYHKKKSHVQEFQRTKFIVFEEKASPTALPPENWVSFLSPKEETLIHKIISSPLSPSPTTTNIDCCGNTVTGTIQSNRNNEFIQIDPESHEDDSYIDDRNQDADEDKDQVCNNSFELNCDFHSNNNDTDKSLIPHEKDPLQIPIAVASTDCNLTNQSREEPIMKSKLKRSAIRSGISRRKIENPPTVSSNILQPVIHPPPNPYVHLKRLNMKTIQNASPHSSSAVYTQENGTNRHNSGAKCGTGNEPPVTDAEQEKINQSCCSTSISPPQTMRKRGTGLKNCKFCLKHFNSTAVLDIHEDTCRLKSKRKFRYLHCVRCLLTFGSSDELNVHNSTFHSNLIPNHRNFDNTDVNPDFDLDPFSNTTVNYNDDIDVGVSEKIFLNVAQDDLTNISVFHDPFSTSESILPDDECNNQNSNEINHQSEFVSNSNISPDPTTEVVNFNYDPILEVMKTEFVADGNGNANEEHWEFSDEDHNNLFKSQSQVELLEAKEDALNLNVAHSASNTVNETQTPEARYFCISCRTPFSHLKYFHEHNKDYHTTQDGKQHFKCPCPNCGKTSNSHWHLKRHFLLVHSNANKPYHCPYLNCKKSFQTPSSRFEHLKTHTPNDGGKRYFECPYPNCEKICNLQCNLRSHIKYVHSDARPFKCPHPNCKQSFKGSHNRNRHLKRCHTKNGLDESSGMETSTC